MQRFALIHDGSEQGWQTAYLAFHVAARLGAPLQALLVNSANDKNALEERAAQVVVGGHAAGLVIEPQIIGEFTSDAIIQHINNVNGLFIPHRLVPDAEAAAQLIRAASCPLWIVPREAETRGLVVLVEDPEKDKDLIAYASMLSQRMSESLTGLIRSGTQQPAFRGEPGMGWMQVEDFSPSGIDPALDHLRADVLFVPLPKFASVSGLDYTCVVFPTEADA